MSQETLPPGSPANAGAPLSLHRALITRMFEDDLDLAKQFARIKLTGPARQHINSALDKLSQLDALKESPATAPEPKAIDV